MTDCLARLQDVLKRTDRIAVAVSGGVDSMTLAHAAARQDAVLEVVHAVSPAVPADATERVKRHAAAAGWRLTLIDAGEFADPAYLKNPVNRCYFCKSNLYSRFRAATDATIAAGTNTDDLGDYRPGLIAAEENAVIHPYVEAGIDKPGVREIAARLGLSDIADLPAQPCLASRVETGIAINADDLAFVHKVETAILQMTGPGDIRCRITRNGVRVELGAAEPPELSEMIRRMCVEDGRVFAGVAPYKRGSAFLHGDGE